jgi:hypothetical protein
MKRIFITLLFIFAVTLSANSQILLTENFSYTAGDSIGAHGWVVVSGSNTNTMMVTTPGLVFPGYALSNIGNATTFTKTGADYYKSFSANDSIGATYCAMMVRIDTCTTAGDYFAAYLPSTSTTNYTARVYAKDSLGFVSFGISKGTAANGIGYSAPIYIKGSTYVLVMKYKWNTGSTTDDEVSLYVFNTPVIPATEPPVATVGPVPSSTADANNIGRIAVRQSTPASAAAGRIDGILAFNNWNELVTNVSTVSTVADKFSLSQNYPNPFNPTTTIRFSLPTSGVTSLKVYDIMGKEVSNLVEANMNAGEYTTQLNASNLSSGMYFYKLEFAGANGQNFSEQKKLMLVK